MTPRLIEQYKLLHKNKPSYGSNVPACMKKYRDGLLKFLRILDAKSVLDFGCGKGHLVKILNDAGYDAVGYDPAIPGKDTFPAGYFDVVVSTDVFEHLDEATMDDELQLIRDKDPTGIYLNIALGRAANHLPDGTNCHTLVKSIDWWKSKLIDFYEGYELTSCSLMPTGARSVIITLIRS